MPKSATWQKPKSREDKSHAGKTTVLDGVQLTSDNRPRADGRLKRIPFDLLGPAEATGGAIFLHGFGGNKLALRHHALALAKLGAKAFAPDLISLTEGGTFREIWVDRSVPSAQANNASQIVAHAQFLDVKRLALVGHSAGGSIALEAAIMLQAAGKSPAVVILLDAVLWDGTIERCAQLDLSQTRLVSLRSEPSAWNKNGNVALGLRRIPQSIPGALVDVKLIGSKHGDAMPASRLLKLLGIVGTGFRNTNQLVEAALREGLALESGTSTLAQLIDALRAEGALQIYS
jgi:dienelactone hydrolase